MSTDPSLQYYYSRERPYVQNLLAYAIDNAASNQALAVQYEDILNAFELASKILKTRNIDPVIANIFIRSANSLARYLGFRGALDTRVTWGLQALKIARRLKKTLFEAELCSSTIAWPLLQIGNYDEAKLFSKQGLKAALKVRDYRWAGEAARTLSGIARDLNQAQEAQLWATRAYGYAQKAKHVDLERRVRMDLGYAELLQHNFAATEGRFRQLLTEFKAAGDKERTANYCNGLAIAILNRGRIDEAENLVNEALPIVKELNSETILGELEFTLARIAEARGHTELASTKSASARQRFVKLGIVRPGRAEQFVYLKRPAHNTATAHKSRRYDSQRN